MTFFRKYFQYILIIFCLMITSLSLSFADDEKKNIIEQTKELVENIGKKQEANTSTDLDEEKDEFDEDVPLVNPFIAGETGGTKLKTFEMESDDGLTLNNLKLVGIATGSYRSFATFADETGEMFTLEVADKLSNGLTLVGVMFNEAIFKYEERLMTINFKNEIFERPFE